MDFFQLQEKAKSRTFLLIFLYCLGLVAWTGFVIVVVLNAHILAHFDDIARGRGVF